MASGAKLPNTNLNLIKDIDMIDHADINAIAQAVEATRELMVGTSGTWTPSLEGSNTKGVAEYTTRNGYWRRMGDIVFIQAQALVSSFTGGAGAFVIKGLPSNFRIKGTAYLGSATKSMEDLGVSHVGISGDIVYLFSAMGTHAVAAQNFTTPKTININGAILLDTP